MLGGFPLFYWQNNRPGPGFQLFWRILSADSLFQSSIEALRHYSQEHAIFLLECGAISASSGLHAWESPQQRP